MIVVYVAVAARYRSTHLSDGCWRRGGERQHPSFLSTVVLPIHGRRVSRDSIPIPPTMANPDRASGRRDAPYIQHAGFTKKEGERTRCAGIFKTARPAGARDSVGLGWFVKMMLSVVYRGRQENRKKKNSGDFLVVSLCGQSLGHVDVEKTAREPILSSRIALYSSDSARLSSCPRAANGGGGRAAELSEKKDTEKTGSETTRSMPACPLLHTQKEKVFRSYHARLSHQQR